MFNNPSPRRNPWNIAAPQGPITAESPTPGEVVLSIPGTNRETGYRAVKIGDNCYRLEVERDEPGLGFATCIPTKLQNHSLKIRSVDTTKPIVIETATGSQTIDID